MFANTIVIASLIDLESGDTAIVGWERGHKAKWLSLIPLPKSPSPLAHSVEEVRDGAMFIASIILIKVGRKRSYIYSGNSMQG